MDTQERKAEKPIDEQLEQLVLDERLLLEESVLIERGWWASSVIDDEMAAVSEGGLVLISDEGSGYRLIGKLRRGEEPRSLNPKAANLLKKIVLLWQDKVTEGGLDKDKILLSVSSLYRSEELQQQLRQSTSNATKGRSAHAAGAAIDFDPNGYYDANSKEGINRKTPGFVEGYIDALRDTLMELNRLDSCHVIWENNYKIEDDRIIKHESCWHVCVNPNFE